MGAAVKDRTFSERKNRLNSYFVPPLMTEPEKRALVLRADAEFRVRMEDVAEQLLQAHELRLIGLTGPTCSGKTTAADILTDFMQTHGKRIHVISLDDFYYDKVFLQNRADADPDIEIDYDSEDTIDHAFLQECADALLSGKRTQLPRFDFKTGERVLGDLIEPLANDIFLFEGIQLLYPKVDAILSGHSYSSIYICPRSSVHVGGVLFEPNELRLMRRIVRDHAHRASSAEFTFYLWQSVRDNEEKSIFPNAHRCKHFIDSTMPYDVGMLKPFLTDQLVSISNESPFYRQAQDILQKLAEVDAVSVDYLSENSLYKEFVP